MQNVWNISLCLSCTNQQSQTFTCTFSYGPNKKLYVCGALFASQTPTRVDEFEQKPTLLATPSCGADWANGPVHLSSGCSRRRLRCSDAD